MEPSDKIPTEVIAKYILNDYIRPKTVTCHECHSEAHLDLSWYPEKGYDPRIRRYFCHQCKALTYRLTYREPIPAAKLL